MNQILRSPPIVLRARTRELPRDWAFLFGLGFAIGIAAGALFG